jgi:hypothetical protein
MRNGFLNLLVFLSIIFSIFFEFVSENVLLYSVCVGSGFLFVAFHFLSHQYDYTKRVNQVYLVACLLMFLPAILQNMNFPEKAYKSIFTVFYGFSVLLMLIVFWIEDNSKDYNKSFLPLRLILLVVGYFTVDLSSHINEPYKLMLSILLGIGLFISPNFFLRWKYQSTRSFRFGLIAGIFLLSSLFWAFLNKSKTQFLPIGPFQIIAYYLVSVPFIKDKVLPNWMILLFKNSEKTKRKIRRRERFRYKRAMEQENN